MTTSPILAVTVVVAKTLFFNDIVHSHCFTWTLLTSNLTKMQKPVPYTIGPVPHHHAFHLLFVLGRCVAHICSPTNMGTHSMIFLVLGSPKSELLWAYPLIFQEFWLGVLVRHIRRSFASSVRLGSIHGASYMAIA